MLPLKIRPLTADFGAEVRDLDLSNTDENLSAAILDQLDESALLLFRRQSLHDEDLLRLSQALGPVEEPAAKTVEGLSAAEGRALLEELLGCVLKPEHQYRHNWRMGDLLIYDNAQLLHRRDAFAGLRWLKATRVFVSPQHFAVPD